VLFDFGAFLPEPLQLQMSGIPYSGTSPLLWVIKEVARR